MPKSENQGSKKLRDKGETKSKEMKRGEGKDMDAKGKVAWLQMPMTMVHRVSMRFGTLNLDGVFYTHKVWDITLDITHYFRGVGQSVTQQGILFLFVADANSTSKLYYLTDSFLVALMQCTKANGKKLKIEKRIESRDSFHLDSRNWQLHHNLMGEKMLKYILTNSVCFCAGNINVLMRCLILRLQWVILALGAHSLEEEKEACTSMISMNRITRQKGSCSNFMGNSIFIWMEISVLQGYFKSWNCALDSDFLHNAAVAGFEADSRHGQ